MALRATSDEIKGYGDVEDETPLRPFQDTANAITDYIVSKDTDGVLTTALQKQIEIWLTLHYYQTDKDRRAADQSIGGNKAKVKYLGETGMYFESTFAGQNAITLDPTGELAKLQQQAESGEQEVNVYWLGTDLSRV